MRRILMVLATVFMLVLSMGLTASGTRAQATGSLTVHARYCDPGVVPDNPYAECHDKLLTGFAVDFDGTASAATTGEDGNATFSGLDAGTHYLFVHMPLKATSPIIYCTAGGDGAALPLTSGDGDGSAGVPVEAGRDVVCDWYWQTSDQPSTGTPILTVHAMTCPSDNVPADFWATCSGTPGNNIEFFSGPTSIGSTDADGMLVYDLGSNGVVDLNGGAPGEFARNFLYCSVNSDKSVLIDLTEVVPGTSEQIAIGPDGVTCDWYIVPEDLSGVTQTPAPQPTPTKGAVTQLPNTGAGETNSGSGNEELALLAVLICAIGGFAVLRLRTNR